MKPLVLKPRLRPHNMTHIVETPARGMGRGLGNRVAVTADSYRDTKSLPDFQALRARKRALYVWGTTLAERVADIEARLWQPNYHFSNVYADEIVNLAAAITAWREEIAWLTIEAAREKRRLAA